MALFVLILIESLADHGKPIVDTLMTQTFAIPDLPHLKAARFQTEDEFSRQEKKIKDHLEQIRDPAAARCLMCCCKNSAISMRCDGCGQCALIN